MKLCVSFKEMNGAFDAKFGNVFIVPGSGTVDIGLEKGSGADSTQKPDSFALGSKTTALGDGCVAGAMGYYYSGVDFDNKYIFLSETSVYPSKKVSVTEITECELYRDDLTLGYEVGDRIYTNFGLCGTIEEIQGNCIRYEEDPAYPYAYSEWTWPVIYAPDKPTVGAVSHSAAAFASGKLTQALAAYSAALGRLSRVLAEGGFTSGDGTVVITPYGAVFGKYNEITDDIFVIGNGRCDTDRRNALSVSWGGLLKTHDGVETEGDVVSRSGGTYQAKMTGSADSVVFGMVNQDGSVPNMLRLTADKSSLSKPLDLGSGGLGTRSADEVREYLTELLNLANAVYKDKLGVISEDLRVKSLAALNGEVLATTGTDDPARMYAFGGSAYVALGAGLNYIRLSPDYTTLGKPLTVSSGGTGVKSEAELKEKFLELTKGAYLTENEKLTVVAIEGSIEDEGYNVVTFSDGSTLLVKNGSKGSAGEKGDAGAAGKSAYQYAVDGGYAGTEAEFAEKLSFLMGYTVYGYVDENNNVILSGNIADGAYIKYEMEDGTTVDIGQLVLDNNVYYSVTNNLTNCTNGNSETQAIGGDAYSATISAHSGYELSSVVVTMGGTDITASAVSGGTISIANVTGDIVITAVAELATVSITNWIEEVGYTADTRLSLSSGNEITATDYECTNFIPAKIGDVLRVKNVDLTSENSTNIVFYDSTKTAIVCNGTTHGTSLANFFAASEGNGVNKGTIENTAILTFATDVAYIRIGSKSITDASILTVNQEIA